jgi:RNA polymerase sigma-70 factor (ECF subfamily)
VLRARGDAPEARAALAELCEAYYAPVLAFVAGATRDSDKARDLTQDFFARVLARGGLESADPSRGRFRSYLLGAVKHFVSDMRDRERAARRGGGVEILVLENPTDTSPGIEIEDRMMLPPDQVFDRHWALALLDRVLSRLAGEFEQAGKKTQFEILKPWLTGDNPEPQALTAERLGMNEGAVKVAVHRLRKRYRELMRAEIAQTVGEGGDVGEELRHLIQVLSAGALRNRS